MCVANKWDAWSLEKKCFTNCHQTYWKMWFIARVNFHAFLLLFLVFDFKKIYHLQISLKIYSHKKLAKVKIVIYLLRRRHVMEKFVKMEICFGCAVWWEMSCLFQFRWHQFINARICTVQRNANFTFPQLKIFLFSPFQVETIDSKNEISSFHKLKQGKWLRKFKRFFFSFVPFVCSTPLNSTYFSIALTCHSSACNQLFEIVVEQDIGIRLTQFFSVRSVDVAVLFLRYDFYSQRRHLLNQMFYFTWSENHRKHLNCIL